MSQFGSDFDLVVDLVRDAGRITALTGAGISTDSGIPDFRGPQGVWTRNPDAEKQATLQTYLADPEVRRRAWQSRKSHGAWTAQPNAGHDALVELERAGKLRAVVTQNVDGLHQRAGSSADIVIEVHGTIWFAQCMGCGARTPMAQTLDRVNDDVPDPPCEDCGGILKSATISFGQALDPAVLDLAWQAAAGCDLMLAIGSTLQVHPAAGLCDVAVDHGARLVVVNADPTPYDAMAKPSCAHRSAMCSPPLCAPLSPARCPRVRGMCRSIKTLRPPYADEVTDDDVHAAALQYVRKVAGMRQPAAVNRDVFDRAVHEVAAATSDLLASLTVRPQRSTPESTLNRTSPHTRH